MIDITVREAKKEDLPEVKKLWIEMHEFHAERDSYYKLRDGAGETWINWYKDNLNHENKVCLLAIYGEDIVGFVNLRIENCPPVLCIEKYGMVGAICISQDYRRKNIGKLLAAKSEKWFKEKSINRIEANVASTNEASVAFWNRMGFHPFQYTMVKEI